MLEESYSREGDYTRPINAQRLGLRGWGVAYNRLSALPAD